jgi:hypothetical protein
MSTTKCESYLATTGLVNTLFFRLRLRLPGRPLLTFFAPYPVSQHSMERLWYPSYSAVDGASGGIIAGDIFGFGGYFLSG